MIWPSSVCFDAPPGSIFSRVWRDRSFCRVCVFLSVANIKINNEHETPMGLFELRYDLSV